MLIINEESTVILKPAALYLGFSDGCKMSNSPAILINHVDDIFDESVENVVTGVAGIGALMRENCL